MPRKDKRQARRLARSCWVRADGDAQLAEEMFRAEVRDVGIDPILIATVVYYAVRLFLLWRSQKNKNPSSVPQANEPFFSEDDVEIKTSQQLYAALASEFRPTAGTNQLSVIGIAMDVIRFVLPRFVGSKADALATIKRWWDEIIVPYDVPGIPAFFEAQIERVLEPAIMKAAEQILDSLELQ